MSCQFFICTYLSHLDTLVNNENSKQKKKLRKQTDGNKNLYVSGDQSGKSFLVGHRHGQVNVFALLLLQNVLLDMI